MASNIQVILQKKHFFSYYPYLFQGFAFNSVNEEVAPQRLKCHVEICHVDTEDSPCSTGCFEPTTTTTTTTTSTTTTTANDLPSNPNTHRFCEIHQAWSAECLVAKTCYTYHHVDDWFYNDETYTYYNYEDYECDYTISTVCDPNFEDQEGDGCDYWGSSGDCHTMDNTNILYYGASSTNGFMTPLNCPACGCDPETGPIRMEDRESSRSLTGGARNIKEKKKVFKN